jgi:hypothetical protein
MLERSSIDLLSNKTILRGLSDPKEIALMTLGLYPSHALPQFIHEVTHHWCFNSPVGLAVALLQLEVAAMMVSGEMKTDAARKRARDCILRATVVTAMLRPIAEGMALFAEFDAMVTSHGELVSSPLSLVAALFRGPRFQAINAGDTAKADATNILASPLYTLRTSPQTIDRKTNLLCLPFSIDDDAYLLGYLMVKSLWISGFTRYWRLFDCDLFQILLRSFIFADSTLVRMLLNDAPIEDTSLAVKKLATYIERRLYAFMNCPVESYAVGLEEQNKSVKLGQLDDMLKLERVPWEKKSLQKLAANSISSGFKRLEKFSKKKSGKMFEELARDLVAQRVAMNVVSIEAELKRLSDTKIGISSQGIPIHLMDNAQSVPDHGTGKFSIHLLPNSIDHFCTMRLSDPELLLFSPLSHVGNLGEHSPLDMPAISRSVSSGRGLTEICEKSLEKAIEICGIDLAKFEPSLRKAAFEGYSRLALWGAEDPAATGAVMRDGGFWTLFNGDTTAIEQLARISCWSSLCLSLERQEELCRSHGFGLHEASQRLLQHSDSFKFMFFRLGPDKRPISLA